MNLLDKNWLALSFGMTLAFFACEEPSEIGAGLDPDAVDVEIVYHEIVLPSENIFIDSLKTSNGELIWIGKNKSNIYGETSSRAYCKLYTTRTIPALVHTYDTVTKDPLELEFVKKQSYVLEDAILDLRVLALSSNDPSSTQSFTLHEIEDQLFSGVYYLANHDIPIMANDPSDEFSFKFNLGHLDSVFNKGSKDTITYAVKHKLSDQLKNRLFDVIRLNTASKALTTVFKGIAIEPESDNTALIGINPGGLTGITLKYRIDELDVAKNTTTTIKKDSLIFSFSTASARYNKIQTNRGGSLIGSMNPVNGVVFDTQDDNIYFHPASGIYPKVSIQPVIDYLNQFQKEEGEFIQIIRVEFDIPTALNTGSYNKNVLDFRALFLNESYKINTTGLAPNTTGIFTKNEIYETLVLDDQGYLSYKQYPMQAIFHTDSTIVENHRYNGVASYFLTLLNDKQITVNNLVLFPSNVNTMNQTVFKKEDIKLKLYYSRNN